MIGRKKSGTGGRALSAVSMGLLFVGTLVVVGLLIVFKPQLQSYLGPGETVTAEFSEAYRDRLVPFKSTVKLAGLQVGKVTGVEETPQGTALVSLTVDEDMEKLGPMPSASIEQLTLLGGGFSVELYRGGGPGAFDPSTTIPLDRTRTPVELDPVLEKLDRPVRASLQGTLGNTDRALARGGRDALGRLITSAPKALAPTGDVLEALRGTRPANDLPELVTNLNATAVVVGTRSRQVGEIVGDLHTTTTALTGQSRALSDTINKLSPTLKNTRQGLADLDGTLVRLTDTAGELRPTAKRLGPLLEKLNPVLKDARPLIKDLRDLVQDARPVVEDLTPTAKLATSVLKDVRGPVIDRLNGPIVNGMINSNWRGTGPFEGNGGGAQADHLFYQELAYALTGLGRASQVQDPQGASLNFQVGAGTGTVNGTGLPSFENVLQDLIEQMLSGAGARAPGVPGLPAVPGLPGVPSPVARQGVPAAPSAPAAVPNLPLMGGGR